MQQQSIDLGYVLGNTLSDLSWTGFTVVCAFALIFILWCVLPFAVFGVKRRLDAIESAHRHQTELLTTELRRTNELLARRTGSAVPAEAADPWHAVPARPAVEPAVARPAAAMAGPRPVEPQPAPLAPVLVQATQPGQAYAAYSDDPRPPAPRPRRELRWTRFGGPGANGSVA